MIFFAILLCVSSCQTSERKSTNSKAKDIVREFTEAMNQVNQDVFKAYLKEGAVWHYRGRTREWTPEGEKRVQSNWKRAFPDHEYRIDLIFANKDTVVVLYKYTGTHTDTILGIPPTGNQIAVPEMVVYRLEDELLAEQWVVFDEYLLRQQLNAD
jgi:steroid delta-isomerase-like uncharacterized protein